jgi:hypothetical protein
LLRDDGWRDLTDYFLKVLAGWRDDVWRNMLGLLGATCAAERARVLRRMDDRAASAGTAIAWQSAVSGRLVRLLGSGIRSWPTATGFGLLRRRLAA